MPGNFASRLREIVDAPEVVAAGHRRERAIKRENLQAMARQIELANDLRTQEGNDVRAN